MPALVSRPSVISQGFERCCTLRPLFQLTRVGYAAHYGRSRHDRLGSPGIRPNRACPCARGSCDWRWKSSSPPAWDAHVVAHAWPASGHADHRFRFDQGLNIPETQRIPQDLGRGGDDKETRRLPSAYPATICAATARSLSRPFVHVPRKACCTRTSDTSESSRTLSTVCGQATVGPMSRGVAMHRGIGRHRLNPAAALRFLRAPVDHLRRSVLRPPLASLQAARRGCAAPSRCHVLHDRGVGGDERTLGAELRHHVGQDHARSSGSASMPDPPNSIMA